MRNPHLDNMSNVADFTMPSILHHSTIDKCRSVVYERTSYACLSATNRFSFFFSSFFGGRGVDSVVFEYIICEIGVCFSDATYADDSQHRFYTLTLTFGGRTRLLNQRRQFYGG